MPHHIYLYGPPGSGKATLGQRLAARLSLPFVDLDRQIETEAGCPSRDLLESVGEDGYRTREALALRAAATRADSVIALGDGALLDPRNRALAETGGTLLCLTAPPKTLAEQGTQAPAGSTAEAAAVTRRAAHYASFPRRLDGAAGDVDVLVREAQILCGAFFVAGMGEPYDVRVGAGSLARLGTWAAAHVRHGSTAVVVVDTHTAVPCGEPAIEALRQAGVPAQLLTIPAGEEHKRVDTVAALWSGFLRAGIDRGGLVVAAGGGVVGDLAGFAAATWLRGVRWVGVPTTLLAMVDSSLGGKTAADLPEGKNLIGAFHSPSLVLADTRTLRSLPPAELRCGLAEAVKHGVIGDPALFARFEELAAAGPVTAEALPDELVSRAMAVKVATVVEDPYETGVRAALNLGHTVGHAVEAAGGFALRHGEAVAIGMVAEARLAERMGLAEQGLARRLAALLERLGLPVAMPAGIDRAAFLSALRLDKKRRGGVVRFALPVRVGEVRTGVTVDERLLDEL